MRWAIVILFVGGWLSTVGSLHSSTIEYTLLSCLSLAACVLLLLVLDGPLRKTVPIWIGLFVFLIDYYVKFYAIVLDPTLMNTAGSTGSLGCRIPATEDDLLFTYALTTCGFVAFCVISMMFAVSSDFKTKRTVTKPDGDRPIEWKVGPAVALAMLPLGFKVLMMSRFNFTHGRDDLLLVELPYHLVAITEVFVPCIINLIALSVIDHGERLRRRRTVAAGLALLFSDAAIDLLLITGKAALTFAALDLAFLWVATARKVRLRHVAFAGGWVLLTAILYPFVVAFRSLRVARIPIDASSAMKVIFSRGIRNAPAMAWGRQGSLVGIGRIIFMRLTGAEFVLALVDHRVVPLSWATLDLWMRRGLTSDYSALEIFGLPQGAGHRPLINLCLSLVGEFYMIGGAAMVPLGVAAFTAIALATWRWLLFQRFSVQPAVCAIFLTMFLHRMVEGDLDYQLSRGLPMYILAAVLVECVLRGSSPGRLLINVKELAGKSRLSRAEAQPTSV